MGRHVSMSEGPATAAVAPTAKKKRLRQSSATRLMVKILCAWILLIAGIVALSAYLWDWDKAIGAQTRSTENLVTHRGTDENSAMLQRGINPCGQTLTGFLQARTPEERSQYVRKPLDTIGRMTRFYALNPTVGVKAEDLAVEEFSTLRVGEERGISILWKTGDGQRFDSVFFPEGGEWRLDWEHFVRYSDYPWQLFLNGGGPDTGEFRVLARERLAQDRRHTDEIGIVCYAPRNGTLGETGVPSPEFLLSRGSEEGRLLIAAFAELQANKRPFGDLTGNHDPADMIRVRIRVRREATPDGSRIVLEKVLACHWIEVDEPGVVPVPPKAPEASAP